MRSKWQFVIAAGILSTLALAQEQTHTMVVRQGVRIGDVGPQTFEYMATQSFSFDGDVVKGAPYSAEAVNETTQTLADGNRISRKTSAMLYRDSEGRTRREEALGTIGPWASSGEPAHTVFINDPVSKTNLVLDTRSKTVRKISMPDPSVAKVKAEMSQIEGKMKMLHFEGGGGAGGVGPVTMGFSTTATGPGAEAKLKAELRNNSQQESLGTQMIEGVQAEGTRTTVTIPAGQIGNDRPIQIVSERWYSPELHTVVMTRHSDPRMGDTVYHLTNLTRSEPLPSLFQAPPDYTAAPDNKFFVHTKD
jgi:hypothetical protein